MGVEHKPPHFDRAIKPLQRSHPSEIKAARQRDFNAVWGHMVSWWCAFYFFKYSSMPTAVSKFCNILLTMISFLSIHEMKISSVM